MTEARPLSLAEAVDQAAALLAKDPGGAERRASEILKLAPQDPRARLILASARRRQGDAQAARALLEPLAKAYPKAAQTYYELGAALDALGETQAATAALRHALSLKGDLAEAWRTLGDILFREGDLQGAEEAYAQHGRAQIQDPALRPAAEALYLGRLDEAGQRLRALLSGRPDDPAAMRLLADVLLRRERFGDAEILLAHSLERDPTQDGVRLNYAIASFRQQKAAQALPHIERLLAADPAHPAYRNLMAACLGLIGEDERSICLYQGLLADYPKQPRIWLNYAHALRAVGRRAEAVDAYKRCIALAPGLGDAYWSLANLKVASFTAEEEAAMRAQLERVDLPNEDRLHLCFALGKALEDRGDPGGAFSHYAQGAAIRREQARYDAGATTAQFGRTKAVFTPALFAARAGMGSSAPDPIFIVGLPRSGSTLIEQILASHSAVEGARELPDLGFIARNLGADYPEAVAGLAPDQLQALGDGYIASTRIHRKLDRPLFIDKMPNNFQHIGLIQLILPRARIIDARRHPLGTCFSAFKQHFAQGQTFSYDLGDLGRYYRDYVDLMAHFDRALPGRVHRVIYEDMVEDTETQVRRLLDYCGLPFEAACLKFYENDRAVRTVSSEQVRRPIFREGLEQWRRFEPWLNPLKAALGPALEGWRGDQAAFEIPS
ncbi:MAG: sulfotransferase [Caulobacteraceae bacterium]|nr:sulfotransferase [Caulobacteraceae bacterium]